MNIRLTGLSILIGALFAVPAATATTVSPAAITSAQQGEAAAFVLAQTQTQTQTQAQTQAQQHQSQSREGERKGQGYSNESDHAGHGQAEQGGRGKGKGKGGSEAGQSDHEGHDHGDQAKQEKGKGKGKGKGKEKGKNKDGDKEGHDHGDKGGHDHHSYAHNVAKQAEVLGLSDEQLGKIVRIHLKADPEAHDRLKKKMKESMKAFRKAVAQPSVDEAALRKLGQDFVDSFNEMVAHHVEERKAVLSVLTPEQIEKLKEIKSEHDHDH